MTARTSAALVPHPQATAIISAVRSCVGTPFRPQGRLPGVGLDCIGVAIIAARAAGLDISTPPYQLNRNHDGLLGAAFAALKLEATSRCGPGDIAVFAPAPGRRHLVVQVSQRHLASVVHAHAGVGRVVESSIDPAWQLCGVWRFPEGE